MKSTWQSKFILFLSFLFAFILYYPSLFSFYTNDDFFLLKISRAYNLIDFLNFFNPYSGPEGLGMYRPLTTQAYYFLANVLNLNPLVLHVVSFTFLFAVISLIYKFVGMLTRNNMMASIAALLYSTSATHFGHMYYSATFQELGMTLFVLLSVICFISDKRFLSILFFVFGLMSKETAIVTPVLALMAEYLINRYKKQKTKPSMLFNGIFPFIVVLGFYTFFRVFYYGFATGDSYIWNFNPLKAINTTFWYLLWSFNLPETLVDFVGPGFNINPNLFLYWGRSVWPILLFFLFEILLVLYFFYLRLRIERSGNNGYSVIILFCLVWFIVSLLPVMFLPVHKFAFYLTLPLIGIAALVAYVIVKNKSSQILVIIFVCIWITTSFLTLRHTQSTSWITLGQQVSLRVYDYMNKNSQRFGNGLVFIDTEFDSGLPYKPSIILKNTLSDQNFFAVYFPELYGNVYFGEGRGDKVEARIFLGY